MTATPVLNMRPIKRTDVFQEVLHRLDTLASDAAYKPGDRLPPERELAERLGVSRTLVRQALKLLEAAGKVVSRIGSGTYIADPAPRNNPCLLSHTVPREVDRDFLQKLIELRSLIEQQIFTSFCRSHTEQQLAELRSLLEETQKECVPDEDLLSLDVSFEEKVGEFVGNELLYCVQNQLHQAWIMAWTRSGCVPERQEVLHKEHLGLLEALHAGDCGDVAHRILAHVNRTYEL